jgi:hypothetical protein
LPEGFADPTSPHLQRTNKIEAFMAVGSSHILDLTQITHGSRRLRSRAHLARLDTQEVLECYTQKVSVLGVAVSLTRQLPLSSSYAISFGVLLDGISHPVRVVGVVSSSVCSGLNGFVVSLRLADMDEASESVLRRFCE